MKCCLACSACHDSSLSNCPSCGVGPTLVDGFSAYAPDLAHEGAGFKSNYFAELAQVEEASFWFRCRNRLIIWALKEYFPNFQSLIEVGCGTGYVLSGIARAFPQAILQGSEIFTVGLEFAATRLPLANFMQMDARYIPFKDEFDAIGAFDVLEHIKEDTQVLAQMHSALKPQGIMLLTVPQHKWLWSSVDECALHVCRYSAKELHQKIESAGFEILRSTSFVSSLLPAMMISRLRQNQTPIHKLDITSEFRISPWMNAIFAKILSVELALIRMGFDFPVGGSRLVVARKLGGENTL
jgi:SAM-dependent methyltransferase